MRKKIKLVAKIASLFKFTQYVQISERLDEKNAKFPAAPPKGPLCQVKARGLFLYVRSPEGRILL